MSENKSWTVEVIQDPANSEDLLLEFPEELLQRAGWKAGDTIVWTIENDAVILSKKITEE